MIYVLVWLNGALVGAIVMTLHIWWQLATGRRTVKPWSEVFQETRDE